MSQSYRTPQIPVLAFVTLLMVASPSANALSCSVDCESIVTVDTGPTPCTYKWADGSFEVPTHFPGAGQPTLKLRWRLKDAQNTWLWTNNGVFLQSPENDPDQDLSSGASLATPAYTYQWEVVHLRKRKFKIDMEIYVGTQRCIKATGQPDYYIDLQ